MIGYFKAEVLRFIKSPVFYLMIILSFLYSVFGIWVFYSNNYLIKDLFYDFTSEYIIILTILSFFITNYLFYDDVSKGLIHFYKIGKMLLVKMVMFIILLSLGYILNYLFTLIMSLFIFSDIHLYLRVVGTFIKIMPMLLFYNEIFIIIITLCKKSSYGFVFIYLVYALISYISNYLLTNNITKFNKMFFMNLNFNSIVCDKYLAIFHFIIVFLGLYFLIYFILRKVK